MMFQSGYQAKSKFLKDIDEYKLKKAFIAENKQLKTELNQVMSCGNELQSRINMRFMKDNCKETELKSYIGHLNGKLYKTSSETDKKIEKLHNDIIDLISIIQSKVKSEIEYTKKEMEREVENKFNEAERKQKELMNQKIKEQTKVFDKMNLTRGELEKIIRRFEDTNSECESLLKRNEELRVTLDTTKGNNNRLAKKLEMIKNEYEKLTDDHSRLNTIVSNKERPISKAREFFIDNRNVSGSGSVIQSINDVDRTKESNLRVTSVNNEKKIIKTLQNNIAYAQKDYNEAYNCFITEQRKRTEAQQLLQKCIEDVSIELISAKNKLAHLKSDATEVRNSINLYIARLEEKIRVLTFVYDNGLAIREKNKTLMK